MATDSSNVRVAVTGEVSVGPTATTAPADIDAALTGFVGLGYVGEDGITESRERSTTDIKAWQNADTVRTVVTDANLSYTFKLIETTEAALELFYGSSADTDGSLTVTPATTGGRKSFVIDVEDGADLLRIYIPEGEVSEVGDVVYASGEPIGYEVTVRAYPNTDLGGSAQIFSSALPVTP